MASRTKFTWILSLVLLGALGWFFREKLGFIIEGLHRIEQANGLVVVLVVVFAFSSIAAMAEVMRTLIGAGKVTVPLHETYAITLAANAWSTTLPAGPAFAALLTFQVQRKWGASVALCSYFFFLSSVVSTLALAIIGLAGVFFLNADMALGSLFATIALALAATGGMFWLTSHPNSLTKWLGRQKLLTGAPREKIIKEVHNLNEVSLSAGNFCYVTGISFAHRCCDMLALWACVWAVTGEIPWLRAAENATTMAGVALAFLAAKLAASAQVTPAGLGTVEAALIGPLVATGMTAADATSTAIIYRLISFALVTILGWVIYFFHYARHGLSYRALNRKDS